MIIGVGHDCVDIKRIQFLLKRFNERFVQKLFTEKERKVAALQKNPAAFYAKRFAGKEAFLKALGTGFQEGISWQDICITNNELGRPLIEIRGKAATFLTDPVAIHVSLSDTADQAHAFVVIESKKDFL